MKWCVQLNERKSQVRADTKQKKSMVIQLCMPTTEEEDEKFRRMYEDLVNITEKFKGEEILVVGLLGDWKATVVEEEEISIVGNYGIGKRNERRDRLVEFSIKENNKYNNR